MRIESLLSLVLLGSLGLGCDVEPNPIVPFLDDWDNGAERLQLPLQADGGYDVSTLRIGGLGSKNFYNRGDIVVVYDAEPGEMVIDVRRFAHGETEEDAQNVFDRLQLWLSDTSFEQPIPANELTPDQRCDLGMWRDGCGIRTWYDGLTQRVHAGMDLRVHLPPDFLANVIVTTEDNDHSDDYLNRGNVCLWDVPASATVNLERGEALVKLADDVVPTPTCSPENISACDELDWSNDCPCLALGQAASSITIEGVESDVAVSVPSTTWSNVLAENRAGLLPSGENCVASLDVPGAVLEPADYEWELQGEIAPRDNVSGALRIQAFSDECGPVQHVESPDRFVAGGEGDLDSRRGDITVCDGCIQNASCDDFLRDGLQLSNGR